MQSVAWWRHLWKVVSPRNPRLLLAAYLLTSHRCAFARVCSSLLPRLQQWGQANRLPVLSWLRFKWSHHLLSLSLLYLVNILFLRAEASVHKEEPLDVASNPGLPWRRLSLDPGSSALLWMALVGWASFDCYKSLAGQDEEKLRWQLHYRHQSVDHYI